MNDTQDVRIPEELFHLFHEGLMMGHSHGPSEEFLVEISHPTLEKHQRFYELLYKLFNPDPLECCMCGEKSFTIYPYDPSTGYCAAEDKTWTIRPGKNIPPKICRCGEYGTCSVCIEAHRRFQEGRA